MAMARLFRPGHRAHLWVLVAAACGGGSTRETDASPADAAPVDAAVGWDVDRDGIPELAAGYIDVGVVDRISRFRSGEGHDYSDAYETCRSMKHYVQPRAELDWSTLEIRSPVAGTVSRVEEESAGTRVEIQLASHPAFLVILFHVVLSQPLSAGDEVAVDQQLGHHVGNQTFSDIAVAVTDPAGQRRLLSYFDFMTDAAFAAYQERGVAERGDLIISRADRDADPLECDGGLFTSPGTIENWIILE